MNDKLINELKKAYDVSPRNKEKFIRSIRKNDLSLFKFVLLQCKYMHNNAFLKCFILVILLSLICIKANTNDTLLFVSAGIPLIVLVMIYELETSKIYSVEELEQATRFSLKTLVLSRLLITGIVSFVSVVLISVITIKTKEVSNIQTCVYFFLPYCLTIILCMKILRKYKDEGIKYCFISAALVSLFFVFIGNVPVILNILSKTNVSLSLLSISVVMVFFESKKFIVNMEECIWN